ncbi:MAG TPA: hypothetical protein PKA64_25760 [Myxococcota bacterium]|nr:hypothetical protein [Myxococcota bacterium]
MAAIESFTCKNSEQRAVLHLGSLRDPGTLWSDTAVAAADARARAAWKLDGAARCKGTGEVEVVTSDEPFGDAAAWATEVRDAFARDHGSAKVTIVEEATPLAP